MLLFRAITKPTKYCLVVVLPRNTIMVSYTVYCPCNKLQLFGMKVSPFCDRSLDDSQFFCHPPFFLLSALDSVRRFLGNQTHQDYFKLLRQDGDTLIIGARNVIYNVSLADLTENVEQVRRLARLSLFTTFITTSSAVWRSLCLRRGGGTKFFYFLEMKRFL